ncbi:hypothetical protein RHGRI_016480 [Rhododendron griersonianum]|uniref:Uncharacterized protein n=1 Tax=Rhododendron griersonianum TaxID=479676 RepID=A0AAV6JU88_9ERIC|nr:hypothetical protein RHGRI_016480 [Rhododendron griersonianum]
MSKPVKGEEALSLGLVDAIVSPDELVSTARRWALDILERRRPWVASLYKTDKIEPLGEAKEIFKFARAQARKQAPNLKHPIVCIDVIEAGIVSGPRAGLWKEAEDFQELLHSDTCKSLVHIFFAQRGTSRRVDWAAEDATHGEEEVELLVVDLQQVLGVELDRECAGEVQHPLDDIEAAVLAKDLEVEAAARESYKIRAWWREIFMQPPR